MCGIIGTLCFDQHKDQINSGRLEKMRDTMVHRGPDGHGVWLSDNLKVGFGHRRLAIVDLSEKALQPMTNQDQSIALVFNGEIYNHQAIRQELNQKYSDIQWKTDHSDTEVILRGYEKWGIEIVHKLRGMFAFSIWDSKQKKMYLVRDRFGIKPLYYSFLQGRISFASEIKALLADPDQKREVNHEAVFHYLSFLTAPAPLTFFKDIYKLPASHYLEIQTDGAQKLHRYYDLLKQKKSDQDLVSVEKDLVTELQQSVVLHQESDVPVGVFLSGGIDSSLNVALFSRGRQQGLKTFTIGYDATSKSYGDERPFARQVAEQFKTEHHEKILTENDLIEFIPRMIHLQDEPIGDPVCFPVYYVSKSAIDNGVKVCQVGEGSDELFLGYPLWQSRIRLSLLNKIPLMGVFKWFGLKILKLLNRDRSWAYELLRRGLKKQPLFWGGAEAFTETEKSYLLNAEFRNQLNVKSSFAAFEKEWKHFNHKATEKSDLNWMTYLDLNLRLPELLLMRVDKMGMGVSLEARVPFLDHKFVEFVYGLPTKLKQGSVSSELKPLLKRAIRGIIPDTIIDRPKQGFGVPLHDWLISRLGAEMKEAIQDFNKKMNYFDSNELNRLLNSGRSAQIWYLYNLACWYKMNFEESQGVA